MAMAGRVTAPPLFIAALPTNSDGGGCYVGECAQSETGAGQLAIVLRLTCPAGNQAVLLQWLEVFTGFRSLDPR